MGFLDKAKIYRDVIHDTITVSRVANCIINTKYFQRLRYLHQLGVCYYVFSNAFWIFWYSDLLWCSVFSYFFIFPFFRFFSILFFGLLFVYFVCFLFLFSLFLPIVFFLFRISAFSDYYVSSFYYINAEYSNTRKLGYIYIYL